MMFALIVVAGALVGLLFLVLGFLVFLRPLSVDFFFHRLALKMAGLRRRKITGPDGPLVYFEGGEGDTTMLLLHGAGDNAGTWARIVRPLLGKYHLLIPDLFGHGQSGPPEGPIGIDQLLAGVEFLLKELAAEQRLILVGNSLGAWLTFLVALHHPERVERIIAINGGPIRQDNPAVNLLPSDREAARLMMKGLMGSGARPVPGWVLDDIVRQAWKGPIARIAATADQMAKHLLDGRLEEIPAPVDLLWGEDDGLFPPSYAERLLEGLPAARLTILSGCGHVPQRECPDQVIKGMLELLEAGSPGPGQQKEEP